MRQKNQPQYKTIILIYFGVRIPEDKSSKKKNGKTPPNRFHILYSYNHRATREEMMKSVTLKKTKSEAVDWFKVTLFYIYCLLLQLLHKC